MHHQLLRVGAHHHGAIIAFSLLLLLRVVFRTAGCLNTETISKHICWKEKLSREKDFHSKNIKNLQLLLYFVLYRPSSFSLSGSQGGGAYHSLTQTIIHTYSQLNQHARLWSVGGASNTPLWA